MLTLQTHGLPVVVTLAAAAVLAIGAALAGVVVAGLPGAAEREPPPRSPEHPQRRQFRQFVLNALLVPLMDDAEPPRWTTAALPFVCGRGARVSVDGRPLENGAPVPQPPFALRWEADRCTPLGAGAVRMDGTVDLLVRREGAYLTAAVDARALRLTTSEGAAMGLGQFDAAPALVPLQLR
jgi:hypothetical protein